MTCKNCGLEYSGDICPNCRYKPPKVNNSNKSGFFKTISGFFKKMSDYPELIVIVKIAVAIALMVAFTICIKNLNAFPAVILFMVILGLIYSIFAQIAPPMDQGGTSKQNLTKNAQHKAVPVSKGIPQKVNFEIPFELPNGQKLYKRYDKTRICILSFAKPPVGKLVIGGALNFVQEPDNDYDYKAIAIYQGNIKIGYFYKGSAQNMTNDFLNRGDTVLGFLTHIDKEADYAEMMTVYYKDIPSKNDVKTNTKGSDSRIVTTEDELEAYFLIKEILKDTVDRDDILYKDNVTYMAILYKGKASKWICRLYFNGKNKYITIPDGSKTGEKIPIENVYAIEKHKDKLIKAVSDFI